MISRISLSALAVLLSTLASSASTLVYEATFTFTLQNYRMDTFSAWRINSDNEVEFADFEDLFDFPIGVERSGQIRVFADTPGLYPETLLTLDCSSFLPCAFNVFPFNGSYGGLYFASHFSDAGNSFSAVASTWSWVQTLDIGPDGGSFYLSNDIPVNGVSAEGFNWYALGTNEHYDISNVTITLPAPVPLPASIFLMALAVSSFLGLRRRL